MSVDLAPPSDGTGQVLALVEADEALREVCLKIRREDDLRKSNQNGRIVGTIIVDGIRFAVLAEDRSSSADETEGLLKLTNRELQIACLVRQGACNKQIARRLRISPYTVASYLKRMFPKLGCTSRTEMAAIVAQVQPHVDL
ncbi:regulatory protein, luxR family [Roseivivax lentus]|uniref:Regulatory protein, luxR family n=1 Tax=Roseivivax lentus TaxID=633194 RepID=A0A1N7NP37_9RHOB|nr:helix-turn-helix transcriptional regulator [Roseivivax lentus]SIT00175.1 regulatory protein, luxR family [Roseivivax lentus]